jgi:hypothetical protein
MSIYRGAAWSQGFVLKYKSSGLPINISAWTFRAEFQVKASDAVALVQLTTSNGGITITDGANGKFTMSMTGGGVAGQTDGLPLGRIVFDVVRTDTEPSPGPTYLFGGTVRVKDMASNS